MSKTIRLFALLWAVGFAQSAFAQSTFCLSFANQTVSGTNLDVTLRLYSSDGNVKLGTSNFVFTYNTAALSNPTYLSSPLTGYDLSNPALTVTAPQSGQVSFNAMYEGPDGGGATVPTSGLDMVVIRFTVTNSALPYNFTWLYNGGTTQTVAFDDDNATQVFRSGAGACEPSISVKSFLNAAYDVSNNLLNDGLRANNKLPLNQPYNTLTFSGSTAYTGTEATTNGVLSVTGANAISDWVLLELRSAITPATVVARRAALLQRDGDIVDVDGVSPVKFTGLEAGNYHVVVRHRLCLATRTQTAIGLNTGGETPLNFTNNSNALAGSLKPVTVGASTFYMMYTGDCNRNGLITTGDLNEIRGMMNTLPANIEYFTRNLDLDLRASIVNGDLTLLRQNINQTQVNLNQ
jgi:hypothetical protein